MSQTNMPNLKALAYILFRYLAHMVFKNKIQRGIIQKRAIREKKKKIWVNYSFMPNVRMQFQNPYSPFKS